MYLKIHRIPGSGDVVAVCDRELQNQVLTDEGREVRIHESFYGNRLVDEEEVRAALDGASNINLMGERVVAIAINMGLLERSACIFIGSVPHALIYRV
ncbi:DUF424 domain-containing protein [Methanosphaerula subterraneus]|uniref:DUF424 domain-containing protein n=1 Tax=Methanosphaerula subterraneus TaxID=3350244 RepID=UPI003F870079